jgi:hypothetical protein
MRRIKCILVIPWAERSDGGGRSNDHRTSIVLPKLASKNLDLEIHEKKNSALCPTNAPVQFFEVKDNFYFLCKIIATVFLGARQPALNS